ncbi:MAG: histone H1 [Chlorobiaceae bacterium]|nr:histone H1 [Chlorobiaceae bacterium]MBA4308788.1 histone H1 [Chlorobiaceae bacterium]
MENYKKLVDAIQSLEVDFQKFYEKGQSAAGTRLRKGLSDLKKLSQDVRNDIQKVKVERKTKA